jgi:SDR family mycofactocin-dependent oxidoreductase
MTSRLQGKVVAISGGARGQGRAHAVAFAEEGASVAICDVPRELKTVHYPLGTSQDLATTRSMVEATGGECLAVEANVASPEEMESFASDVIERFGRIDVVIANAGISTGGDSSPDTTTEEWQETIDVNLSGVWFFLKPLIPQMINGRRGGSIIITSSAAGLKAVAGGVAYTAAKHGVVGIMRALARELAEHSIRVNTVHPTGVATPMVLNDWFQSRLKESTALSSARNLLHVPLIEPADVANAMVWLASDDARYVTGVTLPVDAGFLAR